MNIRTLIVRLETCSRPAVLALGVVLTLLLGAADFATGPEISFAFFIDNFKVVNDRFGHSEGDKVLRTVAATVRDGIRASDLVARLGGDEFAVLLPETGEDAACLVTSKLHLRLTEAAGRAGWPITFSVGVLRCREAPPSVDEMVRLADALMYEVKNREKDGLRYGRYPAVPAGSDAAARAGG